MFGIDGAEGPTPSIDTTGGIVEGSDHAWTAERIDGADFPVFPPDKRNVVW